MQRRLAYRGPFLCYHEQNIEELSHGLHGQAQKKAQRGQIMATNKDGLEPGQTVDFQTLMRVKRQPREAEEKPTKRTRKQKEQTDETPETSGSE